MGLWFKAQHDDPSWQKIPSDFDQTQWQLRHTAPLHRLTGNYRQHGCRVTLEDQNQVALRPRPS